MNFNIVITDKVALPDANAPIIICGNSSYVIDFVFDNEWNEHEIKTALFTFKRNGQKKSIPVVFTGTQCNVPILSGIDEVYVGVFAGELQTTTPAKLFCKKSALCDVAKIEDPPKDVYTQLLEVLKNNFPVEAGITANEAAQNANNAAEETNNLNNRLSNFITETQQSLKTIFAEVMSGEVVWENPDMAANFPAQEIALDLAKYKSFVLVYMEYGSTINNSKFNEITIHEKNVTYRLHQFTTTFERTRTFEVYDTKIRFSTAITSASNATPDDGCMVPYKLYGFEW